MVDEQSPLFQDILISTARMRDINEDSLYPVDLIDFDVQIGNESSASSFELFSLDYINDEEPRSVDEFLSNSSFDLPQDSSIPQSPPLICTNLQHHTVPTYSPPIHSYHQPYYSLTFSNPPDPIYHVRYLSEVTSSPLDGSIVNTKKTKKNVSGRYLKGTHGRHVTIDLPFNLSDSLNWFIRVTRLTVPYQNTSYVHPYPLLYAPPKKKSHSDVIIKGPSIYYKLNKEEICSRSKQFPNIILTRCKQCQLKDISTLSAFDKGGILHSFNGDNAKSKIANYQLKKSQLDFSLVVLKCNKTVEFEDSNISCRSAALLEEEGTECKKLAISPSL